MARVRGAQIYSTEVLEELKKAMAESPREGEDDEVTFKQKMNALQRFLNHGMSRFSIETWHHTLSALFHTYQQGHHSNGPLDDQALTKLTAVSHLRALSRDVILQRQGGSLRETDAHGLKYLENFLAALQCLKEAKAFIDDVFEYMYYHYYDPDSSQSKESTYICSAKAQRHADGDHVIMGIDVRDMQMDASSFGILTLQQMTGSTQRKLSRTVSDMKDIMTRWDHLHTDDEIPLDDLDPESQQDLLLLHGTGSFEHVLRLLPDIFAKYYKCLELAKQWWVLAHETYSELPICRQPTPDSPSPQGSEGRSNDTAEDAGQSPVSQRSDSKAEREVSPSEQLEAVLEEIQKKEEQLQSFHDELELLEERERHFESLVETYENVTAQLESKRREKKELVTARERERQSQHGETSCAESGPGQHRKVSTDSMQGLDAQIERCEREAQLLQFQQALLLQDYMIQLEVRPSLIRFTEDLKLRIQEAKQGLTEQMNEKSRLQNLMLNGDSGENGDDDVRTVTDSVSPLKDQQEEDGSPPPPAAKKSTHSKSAEKRTELARIQSRPRREDTSESSVQPARTEAATAAVAPVREAKRRVSHPQGRRELQERTKDSDPNTNSSSVARGAPPKPAKDNAKTAGKPPRNLSVPASNVTAKEPNLTVADSGTDKAKQPEQAESLFQRRARRKQAAAAASQVTEAKPTDADSKTEPTQSMRPRAKSDPHTVTLEPKPIRKDGRALRRQKTSDSEKMGQQTKKDNGRDNGTAAARPKPPAAGGRSKDKAPQQNGETGVRKKSNYTNV